MAINPALLVAAPILQDYFSDNATDAAMSAGVITCFQDNSRTTLKNWYYQTGSPGAYTYTQLPNPLTLSAAGTIADANGNDVIPFWYPYSEADNSTPQLYYVTVVNSNGQVQFTRQNWPPLPQNNSALTSTLKNLIVNNVFYRNQGSLSLTNTQQAIIAPSQHEGFLSVASGSQSPMTDMQFIKNANGATDTITFTQFSNTNKLTNNDPTPEYYLNFQCANSGTSETVKYIQIPICLHTANLSGYPNASFSIWTQNSAGAANNQIQVNLFQFLGTGATSPTASTLVTITPGSQWTRTVIPFAFPNATIPAGGPGDDGWFLQINFPVGVAFNMNIAKPSVYLSTVVPTDDFDTYETVSGTINSPRTGDIRTSLNDYQPFGWVPLNNGTIGNASSNATGRKNLDTWPLFNLLWSKFSAYTSGSTNLLAQMVTSAGANVAYGASAIADWNANNALTLTQTMGRVLLGTVPPSTEIISYSTTFTGSNGGGNILLTTGNNISYFNGMPVYITTTGSVPDSLALNTIYYVANFNGTNAFNLSTTFANAMSGTVIAYGATSGASCSVVASLVNSQSGEYAHTLLRPELPDPITGTAIVTAVGVGGLNVIGSGTAYGAGVVSNQGGNQPHNNVQPGVFVNMYMKL